MKQTATELTDLLVHLPVPDLDRDPGPAGRRPHRPLALLACRDASASKWGSRWLEGAGFEVAVSRDGVEALRLLEDRPPAVVLVDAALRDDQGRRLCAALRQLPAAQGTPVLVLCASDREAQIALEAGASDVVRKPFTWQIVARRADYLARMFRAMDDLERTRSMLEEARSVADGTRKRIQRWSTTDRLTGLPNRALFEQVLDSALACSSGGVAVLFLDLDRFRVINETLGRHLGDQILRQVAQRLSACLRDSDCIVRHGPGPRTSALARLSGDEFTLMLTNVGGAEEVGGVAQDLLQALSSGFQVGEQEVFLSASGGIALSPDHGKDGEDLLQHAELAMGEAKRQGGGLVRLYSRSLNGAAERSLELNRLLRAAFERGELELHYQPLVEFASRKVLGAEALLRWQHGDLGHVPAEEFVPLAEEAGLMVPIGTWVLRSACRQLRAWLDEGLPPIRMAINVSLCQLVRADLAEAVAEVLAETGVPPSLVELELSERGVLRSDPDILRQLKEIKEMGVRLSVDDFGTGSSGITYLKRFPLDTLKIDQSYVTGVVASDNDAVIASAIIAMAHRLRLNVIAEGVEEEPQLEFLRECGCNEYQGFLFSKALPPDEFRRLLADEVRRPSQCQPEVAEP